ncbi:hypothetical protein CLOM_g15445 [Closterium sp. NIES-68]|nr:hypothetical protein CLOM_g15445 [Closterium sp. NIES-68]GJP64203.1 hypothetical protein CLOP_g21217 [Closterium sp. NIES-67]
MAPSRAPFPAFSARYALVLSLLLALAIPAIHGLSDPHDPIPSAAPASESPASTAPPASSASASAPNASLSASPLPSSLLAALDPVTRLAKTASLTVASVFPPAPDAKTLQPGSQEYFNLFVEETTFYNHLVLSFLPSSFVASLPHFPQTWLRNYVAGCLLYLIGSGLWSLVVYSLFGWYLYSGPDDIPSLKAMWRQIAVSMRAMPLYTLLPTISESLVERGWTRCYSQIGEASAPRYILGLLAYLLIVEFGIYWAHRLLHDIKPAYTYLHAIHHIYNKQNTLSPFAGLAFHPLDGIIQALPHVFSLFLVPMHFTTHLLLLFAEGIWTTNIHDNLHGNVLFIMGAKYHTIHHTTYRHNYGHYTVLFDWLFGTLHSPEQYEEERRQAKGKAKVEEGEEEGKKVK